MSYSQFHISLPRSLWVMLCALVTLVSITWWNLVLLKWDLGESLTGIMGFWGRNVPCPLAKSLGFGCHLEESHCRPFGLSGMILPLPLIAISGMQTKATLSNAIRQRPLLTMQQLFGIKCSKIQEGDNLWWCSHQIEQIVWSEWTCQSSVKW